MGKPTWDGWAEREEDSPTAETILDTAARVTSTERNRDYGTPLVNHGRTAALWSAYTGREFTPEEVCMMNILQKISRSTAVLTNDTIVDIAGYARNIEMVQEERDFANDMITVNLVRSNNAANDAALSLPIDE